MSETMTERIYPRWNCPACGASIGQNSINKARHQRSCFATNANAVTDSMRARFWAKVDRRGPDECWPWNGSHHQRGYGQLWVGRRLRKASQIAWEIANGTTFLSGKMACHTCDNPTCVNPAHIWAETMSENILDASRKNRIYRGGNRKAS